MCLNCCHRLYFESAFKQKSALNHYVFANWRRFMKGSLHIKAENKLRKGDKQVSDRNSLTRFGSQGQTMVYVDPRGWHYEYDRVNNALRLLSSTPLSSSGSVQ